MDGPFLGKDTDRTAFRDSNIREIFETTLHQHGININDFSLLGDSIFVPRLPCFCSLAMEPDNLLRQREKRIDTKCRGSVEWELGKLCENWKSLSFYHQQQIQAHAVGRDVFVCALLTNLLTLLQGSQSYAYFHTELNFSMPTIQSYLQA